MRRLLAPVFVFACSSSANDPPKPSPAPGSATTAVPSSHAVPAAPPGSPGGELPAACLDYKAAMEKAAACDKLGAQRAQFTAELARSWDAWAKLDATAKAGLATSCTQLANTVRNVTATACP